MTVLDRALTRAYQQRAESNRLREPLVAGAGAASAKTDQELPASPSSQARSERIVSGGPWPGLCEELLARTDQGFFRIAEQLRLAAVERRLKRIGFVSPGRSEGRSTVLLTLALALERGGQQRIALVDADFEKPRLDRLLGMPITTSWWDVACGRGTRQTLLHPVGKGSVSLAPLASSVAVADLNREALRLEEFLKGLSQQFEIVLIDAGPVVPSAGRAPEWIGGCLDAVVTVSSRRKRGYGRMFDQELQHWRQLGIEPLGVIETFAWAGNVDGRDRHPGFLQLERMQSCMRAIGACIGTPSRTIPIPGSFFKAKPTRPPCSSSAI